MIASLCSRYGIAPWDSEIPYPAGTSPLETLPIELLRKILIFTRTTLSANRKSRRVVMPRDPNARVIEEPNLLSVLLTSHKLYHVAIPIFYRNPHLVSPAQFDAFVYQIVQNPSLGSFIRRLDLAHLAPTRTIAEPWNKTTNPLYELLSRTSLLKELHIDQYLGNEISQTVLEIILDNLQHLDTLEFDSCNSPSFQSALARFFLSDEKKAVCNSLVKLSFRNCVVVPGNIFEVMLTTLPRLRSLNLAGTKVDGEGLRKISGCVKLETLDLSGCLSLNRKDVVEFLGSHPAVRSLVSLNLAEDPEAKVLDEEGLGTILSHLPPSIKSLNLRGTCLESSHVPALLNRVQNLECLSAGSQLQLQDLERLFFSPECEWATGEGKTMIIPIIQGTEHQEYQSVLAPMEKAVAVCKVRQRINSFSKEIQQRHKLRYLDISGMSIQEQSKIQFSLFLSPTLKHLEVIEISNLVPVWDQNLSHVCAAVGWKFRSVARRCWLKKGIR